MYFTVLLLDKRKRSLKNNAESQAKRVRREKVNVSNRPMPTTNSSTLSSQFHQQVIPEVPYMYIQVYKI